MRKLIIFIGTIMLLLPSFIFSADLSPEDFTANGLQPLKEGTKLVDFELKDLSGKDVSLSDFEGKVVFLNFWATWCGPCRIEMPSMQEVYTLLKHRGFEIVAVNLQENRKTVQKFVDELGLTFTILLDSKGQVGSMYGARSIPTTYLINREGNVVAGSLGSREWNTQSYIDLFNRLLD